MRSIELQPLKVEDINNLVSAFLRCSKDISMSLSKLIHKKTNGNPFFVNQFLKTLYENKLLVIEANTGWQWNVDEIEKMKVADNVVDLMVDKISSLPEEAVQILKVCACIGNRFDLETISIILEKTIDDTLKQLNIAIELEYISF